MNYETHDTIKSVCGLINQGKIESAAQLVDKKYPFNPIVKSLRQYTTRQKTIIFLRDGFIDKYRGTKLVYPPALRLISYYLPKSFPYHKNGRMEEWIRSILHTGKYFQPSIM